MSGAKAEKRVKETLGSLASAWISLAAFGVALATIVLAILGAVWRPGWTLHFLGIQEQAGDTYPTISNHGNIHLAAEASNVFEKLGPVGDYFGGTINPILTFISICLLLWSIKIQRDEINETRKEMKAATAQAEISARAATASVRVAQISERPFFQLKPGHHWDVFLALEERTGVGNFIKLNINLENIGRSAGIVANVTLKYNYLLNNIENEKILKFSTSIPVGPNSTDKANVIEFLRDEDVFIIKLNENNVSGEYFIEVSYFDSFGIRYKLYYNIIKTYETINSVGFLLNKESFQDCVELENI